MTLVASPVPERYPRGLQAWGGVAAGVRNGPCMGWSVRSSGFPLRESRGNPWDRCLANNDDFMVNRGRRARAEKMTYRNDLLISVSREAYVPRSNECV